MLVGLAFRFYAMSVLGRFFTYDVAVHACQTVIEVGPYRYIRHPSYTGALITLVGLGLALGNWVGLLALLACMAAAYAYRISVEEAALVVALGEPYKQYMRRTRRLAPFLFYTIAPEMWGRTERFWNRGETRVENCETVTGRKRREDVDFALHRSTYL
jgi:protein-S-isoprenylcysteine O-methyltransferase Ste14